MKMTKLLSIIVCIASCSILFSFPMFAETRESFFGKWSFIQEKSKAAAGTSFSGSEVTLNILHTANSITITKTIKNPGGMVDTTSEEYSLDGKESVSSEQNITTKMTGNWSSEKILLIKSVILGSTAFITEDVYSLSANGKILTIHSTETMNSKKSFSLLVYEKE